MLPGSFSSIHLCLTDKGFSSWLVHYYCYVQLILQIIWSYQLPAAADSTSLFSFHVCLNWKSRDHLCLTSFFFTNALDAFLIASCSISLAFSRHFRPCVMSQSNPRQNGLSLSSLTNKKNTFSEPNCLLIYPHEMLIPTAPSTPMELPKGDTAKPHPQLLAFALYYAADNRLWYFCMKNSNQK